LFRVLFLTDGSALSALPLFCFSSSSSSHLVQGSAMKPLPVLLLLLLLLLSIVQGFISYRWFGPLSPSPALLFFFCFFLFANIRLYIKTTRQHGKANRKKAAKKHSLAIKNSSLLGPRPNAETQEKLKAESKKYLRFCV
jgi:hypothetical protein